MKIFGFEINRSQPEEPVDGVMLEAAKLLEADPFEFEFDEPYATGDAEKLGQPARFHLPQEWQMSERREILTRAHYAWERNPIAKGAIKLIRSFALGTGMNLSYRSVEAQEVISKFLENPFLRFDLFEKSLFDTWLIDGELFLRFFVKGERGKANADIRIMPLKPWNVDYIVTDPDDFQDVQFYRVRLERGSGAPGSPLVPRGDWTDIPSKDVMHVPLNSKVYEIRGRSELFSILPWLRAYREWLENRARINRYKGIIYHLQLKQASPSTVKSKQSQFRRPVRPGSIYVSSDQEILNDVGQNIEAGQVAEDGRQIRLMAAVGLTLPEYMLGDGENSNLATASAQALPALRTFADYQDLYSQLVWKPILLRVLEVHYRDVNTMVQEIDADGDEVLDKKGQPKQIRLRDSFTITYPAIEDRKPRDLAEALQIDLLNGLVSRETASQRSGYDYRAEAKKMQDEQVNTPEPVTTPVTNTNGNKPNQGV